MAGALAAARRRVGDHGTPVTAGRSSAAASSVGRLGAAGNRALARLVRPRPRPATPVQRSMYLHNQDDLIYKDTAPANAAAEFAYVHKNAHGTPFYLDYPQVAVLQAAVNARAALWANPRAKQLWFDDLVTNAAAHDADAVAVRNALGTIYAEVGGNVVANPGINQYVVGHIALGAADNGPRYNHIGGGSRLPRAEGALFLNRDCPLNLQTWIGVDQADLASVQVTMMSAAHVTNLPTQFASIGVTNFQAIQTDPTSQVIDVVYTSTVDTRRSANARVRCAGLMANDDQLTNLAPNLAAVTGSFNGLVTPPASSGWIPGTQLVPLGRGGGQVAAMGGWNALGAAAYESTAAGGNRNHNLNQNWEWLHVRAAKLGGATAGGNLVAGLFVTNSEMIPFEDMIFRWAAADPTKFWARFDTTGGRPGFATRITFSVQTVGHAILGDLTLTPFVSFDPLRGQVVDRVANEVIKRGLDRTRTVS